MSPPHPLNNLCRSLSSCFHLFCAGLVLSALFSSLALIHVFQRLMFRSNLSSLPSGLKYRQCSRRISHITTAISHEAHLRSWTLYRKRGFKKKFKKKNYDHISDYQSAASFLIIFQKHLKKKNKKKEKVTAPTTFISSHSCWTSCEFYGVDSNGALLVGRKRWRWWKTERWKEVESDGKVVDGKEERASEGNLQEKRRIFDDASFYIRRGSSCLSSVEDFQFGVEIWFFFFFPNVNRYGRACLKGCGMFLGWRGDERDEWTCAASSLLAGTETHLVHCVFLILKEVHWNV